MNLNKRSTLVITVLNSFGYHVHTFEVLTPSQLPDDVLQLFPQEPEINYMTLDPQRVAESAFTEAYGVLEDGDKPQLWFSPTSFFFDDRVDPHFYDLADLEALGADLKKLFGLLA